MEINSRPDDNPDQVISQEELAQIQPAIDIYLETMAIEAEAGNIECDICPEHSGREVGFIVNRSGPAENKKAAPLVYCPGLQSDDLAFFRTRPYLENDFTVYSFCYRRVGPHVPAQYATDVLEAMDLLGISRFCLLGESMGSIPSLTIATQHPGRVAAISLAGGFTRGVYPWLTSAAKLGIKIVPSIIFRHAINNMIIKSLLPSLGTARTIGGHLAKGYSMMRTAHHMNEAYKRIEMIERWDIRSELHKITAPFYYIAGAWDEQVPVRREIKTLREHVPDFRADLVPGCLHAILPYKPKEAAELVIPFYREAWDSEVKEDSTP